MPDMDPYKKSSAVKVRKKFGIPNFSELFRTLFPLKYKGKPKEKVRKKFGIPNSKFGIPNLKFEIRNLPGLVSFCLLLCTCNNKTKAKFVGADPM
jgi:hypothetical protein